MPINPTALGYAAAYIGGNLAGIALGTAIVKKVLPSKSYRPSTYNVSPSTQIEMLGCDLSPLYK